MAVRVVVKSVSVVILPTGTGIAPPSRESKTPLTMIAVMVMVVNGGVSDSGSGVSAGFNYGNISGPTFCVAPTSSSHLMKLNSSCNNTMVSRVISTTSFVLV